MSDSRVRIICVVIEGDADIVVGKIAEAIENAIGQAPELPKPTPTPFSRPENMQPLPPHLRWHRSPTR
jgi:hypothetical protein